MAESAVKTVTEDPKVLLLKKMAVAGGVAFLAVFLPAILSVFDQVSSGKDLDVSTDFWYSLIAAGIAAALRAVLALSPLNILPTDALHGRGDKPEQVLVEAPSATPPATTATR